MSSFEGGTILVLSEPERSGFDHCMPTKVLVVSACYVRAGEDTI